MVIIGQIWSTSGVLESQRAPHLPFVIRCVGIKGGGNQNGHWMQSYWSTVAGLCWSVMVDKDDLNGIPGKFIQPIGRLAMHLTNLSFYIYAVYEGININILIMDDERSMTTTMAALHSKPWQPWPQFWWCNSSAATNFLYGCIARTLWLSFNYIIRRFTTNKYAHVASPFQLLPQWCSWWPYNMTTTTLIAHIVQ